ncbi:MAG: polysaccharide deacetylase [Lachnospiraceae bacterium]|nr:polysaccharide deacetylase [Lachnospiraceae bacterium]
MTGDKYDEKARAQYRKKRIKRIKKVIITMGVILILLPTVLSIFLMIKMFSLEKQVEKLAAGREQTRQTETTEVAQAKEKETTTPPDATDGSNDASGVSDGTSGTAVSGESKKVYLTFDDSPGTQTEKILDILKEEQVSATFFVIGKEDAYSKKMYKRIVKEGHTLGMHSYSHIYPLLYQSTDSFTKDLDRLSQYLNKITGVSPEFYRFPGGSSIQGTGVPVSELIEVLNGKNISYMDWNVLSPDVNNAGVKKKDMVRGITGEVSRYDTSVVLFNDVADRPMTVKALPAIIKALKKENYELLPIDRTTVPIRHDQK